MSLIEEALRRIQDPLLAKHEAGTAAKPSKVQTPPKAEPLPEPPAAHSWPAAPTPLPRMPAASPSVNPLLAVSFSVLALTAVIVIGGTFWIGHHVVMRPTQVEITDASSRPRPSRRAAAPEEAPPASPAASNGLTLSGVVEGMGESYAVINGMIVGAGEQVGGATVVEVANGAVKLRSAGGDEIVLNVPR